MDNKQPKLKDYGLWDFEQNYEFEEHEYEYHGTVTAKDIAEFLELPMTQEVLDSIKNYADYYEKGIRNGKWFKQFIEDKYYEDASHEFYEEL